ncbi:PAS domain-containing sensor histidine kinase [Novipirellula artificiosorum]|uniref:Oxygen sensor histidine kinase NreB n=1 Tax=Novipirellula artificiosorum TaxID=2528016 RepID=A0A5C6D6A3_9BACT|nr:PAS domain S-box protein [Novipirellula artificiosorum]TWU31354.1 Oxygen sensor histidine kinase NreB [Novipirellula artificiosorum]
MKDETKTTAQLIEALRRLRAKSHDPPSSRNDAWQSFMTASRDGLFFFDSDLRNLYANPAGLDMTGLTATNIIGKPLMDVVPSLEQSGRDAAYRSVIESGLPFQIDQLVPHPKLGPIHVSLTAFKIQDGLGIIVTDITERKQAESALEFASIAYENGLAANSTADVNGIINTVNGSFVSTWGYASKDEVIGKPIPDFLDDPEKSQAILAALHRVGTWQGEFLARRKDGSTFVAESRATLLINKDGTSKGFESSVLDITQRRRAEEAVHQARAELEQKVKSRTEKLRALTAKLIRAEEEERKRIAHILHEDLQQVLVGTRFTLSALNMENIPTEKRQQLLDKIDDQLRRAHQITRSISLDLHPPVLHVEGVGATLEWLKGDMKEKFGMTLTVDADEEAEPTTDGLRTFILQAVRELLLNVVKHAGVKRAQVRLKPHSDDWMLVEVNDKGAGFNPNQTRHCNSFGLFNISERAEHLGGQMEIQSATGKGTRITLIMPRS